eukprot:CFRG0659T1
MDIGPAENILDFHEHMTNVDSIDGYCSMSDDDQCEAFEGSTRFLMHYPECVKTVHFIRHAEGIHNAARSQFGREAYRDWAYYDAELTDTGFEQVLKAKEELETEGVVADVVIASPLTRTLQTAHGIFDSSITPFVAYEGIRERYGAYPCDKRKDVSLLESQYPNVDFGLMKSEKDELWTEIREPEDNIKSRVIEFLDFLVNRPEQRIAVVSHNDFLSTIFNIIRGPRDMRGRFFNCERRTVSLTSACKEGFSDDARR